MDPVTAPTLLVALPQLQDENFERAVLLMVEHNREGAMGFIINRPSEMPVRELILAQEVDIPPHVPAWIGGPVGRDNGLVLHNQEESDAPLGHPGHFAVSSSNLALQGLAEHAQTYEQATTAAKTFEADALYPYRFLVGYAGWDAGQLEEELRSGAWLQLPFDEDIVFNTPWHKMWDQVLAKAGLNPMLLAPTVQPFLN